MGLWDHSAESLIQREGSNAWVGKEGRLFAMGSGSYSARHDLVTWLGVARLSVAQPYVHSAQCRCKTVWACATLPA